VPAENQENNVRFADSRDARFISGFFIPGNRGIFFEEITGIHGRGVRRKLTNPVMKFIGIRQVILS
jgi:hypothetical protein